MFESEACCNASVVEQIFVWTMWLQRDLVSWFLTKCIFNWFPSLIFCVLSIHNSWTLTWQQHQGISLRTCPTASKHCQISLFWPWPLMGSLTKGLPVLVPSKQECQWCKLCLFILMANHSLRSWHLPSKTPWIKGYCWSTTPKSPHRIHYILDYEVDSVFSLNAPWQYKDVNMCACPKVISVSMSNVATNKH